MIGDVLAERSIVSVHSGTKPIPFGTGFVFFRDDECSYVLTCAHVINHISDPDNLLVSGVHKATIVALGNDPADLGVLRTEYLKEKSVLPIRPECGHVGMRFVSYAYQQHSGGFRRRLIEGKLVSCDKVTPWKGQEEFVDWELRVEGGHPLADGNSGAPLVDPHSGCAFAIITSSTQDGISGRALALETLLYVWKSAPACLVINRSVAGGDLASNVKKSILETVKEEESHSFNQRAQRERVLTRLMLKNGEYMSNDAGYMLESILDEIIQTGDLRIHVDGRVSLTNQGKATLRRLRDV